MTTDIAFVLTSLVIILIAAELFTNAVEWFGQRMGLAEGAVGSVLAAIGTALPETMIPIIAILFGGGTSDSEDIGVGAILGAPFLLSTAAFAVTGLGVIAFRKRRVAGIEMRLDADVLRRDLGYFLVLFIIAIGASFLPWQASRYAVAAVLLGLYAVYLYKTFTDEGPPAEHVEELPALRFSRIVRNLRHDGKPHTMMINLQLLVALGMIVGAAHIFVTHLENVSHELGVPALVLALVIAPLATELPEKFNSLVWVRQGKDTLAMGNISGAMVFQSCIPVSVGVVFTEWALTETALVSAGIALASTSIVYLSLAQTGHLSAIVLARAGILWVGFVGYVVAKLSL